MKYIVAFLFVNFFNGVSDAQDHIDFEFSYPENSHFIVEQSTDNSGVMKITGSLREMQNLKARGYNQERKMSYKMSYVTDFKTNKKEKDSFPFEFYYDKVVVNIDSDEKKQQQDFGFPNAKLKGDFNGTNLIVTDFATTGDSQTDTFINSLPKYFTTDFPKINGMKVGQTFVSTRDLESKVSKDYKVSGQFTYTLKTIVSNLAYFDIGVKLLNKKGSIINLTGNGSGEMVYDHSQKFIKSENISINMISEQDEKTFKITSNNTLITTYNLKSL